MGLHGTSYDTHLRRGDQATCFQESYQNSYPGKTEDSDLTPQGAEGNSL